MNIIFMLSERDQKTNYVGINLAYFNTKERALNYLKNYVDKYREFDCGFILTSELVHDDNIKNEDVISFSMKHRILIQLDWNYENKTLTDKLTGETY